LELEALQESLVEINSLGASLAMIAPHLEEHSRALIKEKNLSFELLSDPGNQVAKKFGLVYQVPEDLKQIYLKFDINIEKFNNDDSWTLPIPARYIVDGNSVIRYAEADPDYTIRPDPTHTIEALKFLPKG
jgi:peroxiredoxin